MGRIRRSNIFAGMTVPFLILSVCLLAGPTMAADRALLVGVEKHADARIPNAAGAATDAQALAELLESDFGFAGANIRILIDGEATAVRIEAEFRNWLVDGTRPGDRAFFLFSGHGSRVPDDNGDEKDGLDEALVAFDADAGTGDNELRDDLVDSLVASLSGRRAVVVFDAGSAGTITDAAEATSASGKPRFMPGPEQLATVENGTAWTVVADETNSESFLDDPRRIGNLSGIVVLSAARPGQLAYSIDVDGAARGALSFVFSSLYSDSLEVAATEQGMGEVGSSRGLLGKVGKKMGGTLGGVVKKTALDAVPGSGLSNKLGKDVVGTVTGDTVKQAQKKIPTGKSTASSKSSGAAGTGEAESGRTSARQRFSLSGGSEDKAGEDATGGAAVDREGLEVEAASVGAAAQTTSPPPPPVASGVAASVATGTMVAAATAPAPEPSPPPLAAPAPATAKMVSVAALPGAIGAGMNHLSSAGLLPNGQDPWFEVLSEQPIEPQPLFGDWQQAAAVALQNPLSAADVSISTTDGRTTFRDGDELEFEITSDRAGFLYLLIFSEGDVATCIFPNPGDLNNEVEPGTVTLPGNRSYSFPVQEPFGTDVVLALVSPERLQLCDRMTYTWGQVYAQVDLSSVQESLRQRSSRGVGVSPTVAGDPAGDAAGWQTASFVVTTREK